MKGKEETREDKEQQEAYHCTCSHTEGLHDVTCGGNASIGDAGAFVFLRQTRHVEDGSGLRPAHRTHLKKECYSKHTVKKIKRK